MKKFLYIFSFLGLSAALQAQELNAKIKISYQQALQKNSAIDPSIFAALESSIKQFMNNTRWTTEVYSPEERIQCSFVINLTDAPASDRFTGELTVVSNRPVYGSNFECNMLNTKDLNFDINYVPFQAMEFSETSYINNLTSILSFYAYMIIAIDYDSFAPEGGSNYHNKARQIVQNALQSGEKGWQPNDNAGRNRFAFSEDMLNPAFKAYRTFLYKYHREAFDHFYNDLPNARKKAIEALMGIEEIYKQKPNSFLLQIFFNSKRDEAINMLKGAPKSETVALVQVMRKIDGAFSSRWDEISKVN